MFAEDGLQITHPVADRLLVYVEQFVRPGRGSAGVDPDPRRLDQAFPAGGADLGDRGEFAPVEEGRAGEEPEGDRTVLAAVARAPGTRGWPEARSP